MAQQYRSLADLARGVTPPPAPREDPYLARRRQEIYSGLDEFVPETENDRPRTANARSADIARRRPNLCLWGFGKKLIKERINLWPTTSQIRIFSWCWGRRHATCQISQTTILLCH